MIADSPSSVAESASSTIDPDAQARRANDGELSVGQPEGETPSGYPTTTTTTVLRRTAAEHAPRSAMRWPPPLERSNAG
jgi:hypothetical protein